MILTPPTLPIRAISLTPMAAVARVQSPFTKTVQVFAWPGQQWVGAVELAAMGQDKAREVVAFLTSLNGIEGTFYLADSVFLPPVANLGAPVIDGAGQIGAGVLTRSWAANQLDALKPGSWVHFGGRLRRLTQAVHTDAAGGATLSVWPYAASPADGSTVEWANPRGVWRLLETPDMTWPVDKIMRGVKFGIEEVIT